MSAGTGSASCCGPLGWAFIAVVVVGGLNSHPAAGLTGIRLAIAAAIVVYVGAAAVGLTPGWGERGLVAQAAVIGLVGAGGVALAALQRHGAAGLAASLGVWIAAVRLPGRPAAAAGAAITVALAAAIALTQHPAAQSVIAAVKDRRDAGTLQQPRPARGVPARPAPPARRQPDVACSQRVPHSR